MALKDYERSVNEKEFIRFDKVRGNLISIWVVKRGTNVHGEPWVVEIVQEGEIPPTAKTFKSKSQALAYAKSYMRNH